MTPGARVAAAIGILDQVLAGQSAEQALTNWGRQSRFAGAKDRAALRDLVFDAIRCRRSFAHLGGTETGRGTGRGLMIGAVRAQGGDLAALFTGQGHAPAPLSLAEQVLPAAPEGNVALDCPDWLEAPLRDNLGADFAAVMALMRARATVFLRVNLRRASLPEAVAALAAEGIAARPHPLADTALEVQENARKVHTSRAYAEGLVELQDAASQAILAGLPLTGRVLDYCAGGGGKALALAARGAQVWAHDAAVRRMADLPARAERAGVKVTLLDKVTGQFDLVLVDAPCSGAGAWRRSPEGKWALTPSRLADLCALQAGILDRAQAHVAPGGMLAYATCSLLGAENGAQVAAFVQRYPGWRLMAERQFTPLDGGDGFYIARLHHG